MDHKWIIISKFLYVINFFNVIHIKLIYKLNLNNLIIVLINN
jgi:hypothetical protein